MIAGIAPGLDFDFADFDNGDDFNALIAKASQLMSDGASGVVLMFDDIDAGFSERAGRFEFEGIAHARLANRLSEILTPNQPHNTSIANNKPLCYCVPRIYANELIDGNDPALLGDGDNMRNRRYLIDFLSVLDRSIAWFYCGDAIVSRQPQVQDAKFLLSESENGQIETHTHRCIIWDNFFANDYCPRRLFLGPWSGRHNCGDIFVNPTGLPATDALIMTLVAKDRDLTRNTTNTHNIEITNARHNAWLQCLENVGVPESFQRISHYFRSPVFSSTSESLQTDKATAPEQQQSDHSAELDAIDELLWRWKSPLAREWYPYLLGLKQDLMTAAGGVSDLRIRKQQTAPLADRLTR